MRAGISARPHDPFNLCNCGPAGHYLPAAFQSAIIFTH